MTKCCMTNWLQRNVRLGQRLPWPFQNFSKFYLKFKKMKHAIIYIYISLPICWPYQKGKCWCPYQKGKCWTTIHSLLKKFSYIKNVEFMLKYLQVQILIEKKIVKTKCCMTHWIQQLYAYQRPQKKFEVRKSSKSEKVQSPKKFKVRKFLKSENFWSPKFFEVRKISKSEKFRSPKNF